MIVEDQAPPSTTGIPTRLPGTVASFQGVGKHRIAVYQGGRGPHALLVHGLLGNAFSWRNNTAPLGAVRNVHALDMVGAGYSDRDPALDCSLRAHAGRLLAFLDVQNIATADLVANSHGCAVAMMAAALATQRGEPRVRSFALANPVHPWATFHWPQQLLIKSDLLRAIVAPILFRSRTLQSRFLLRLYGDRSRITPDTLAGYVAPFALPGSMQYAAGIVKSWRSDLQELAALMQHIVDVPALVMWGTKDRAVRVESSAPLHQHFRNVKVVTFDGVGHLPMEEAPDRFNHEVIDFWNKLPA